LQKKGSTTLCPLAYKNNGSFARANKKVAHSLKFLFERTGCRTPENNLVDFCTLSRKPKFYDDILKHSG
jgi:hypothetical protein